jgi:hypothetical protein
MERLWNETDSSTYWDSCILLITEMNLTRKMTILTDCGRWDLSLKLSDAYAKYYSPTEHLAVDEIIVLFKDRVVFKQYSCKKQKYFGIKI